MDNEIRKKARNLDQQALLLTEKIMKIIETVMENCTDPESDKVVISRHSLGVIKSSVAFLQSWIIKTLDDIDEIYGE